MAGALAALYARGKTFDNIWATGAGALVGLVYIAPKDKAPHEALRELLEISIDDRIYRWFPVNYKVFKKSSPLTRTFERWGELWKLSGRTDRPGDSYKRLYNDGIDLLTAIMTPSDLTPLSQGLCEPLPFLEDVIDFDRVQAWPGECIVNAYNLTDHVMEYFDKTAIDALHVRAALAAPFLYTPVTIGTKQYTEGALHDPINLGRFLDPVERATLAPQIFALSDLIGVNQLLRPPRDLWDAFGQSIMTPLVSLANTHEQIFTLFEERQGVRAKFDLIKFRFRVPEELQPYVLDWSYSNMQRLWDIGVEAGENFFVQHQDKLLDIAT
jgi:predicted acylesterase/phospholipase RssA